MAVIIRDELNKKHAPYGKYLLNIYPDIAKLLRKGPADFNGNLVGNLDADKMFEGLNYLANDTSKKAIEIAAQKQNIGTA